MIQHFSRRCFAAALMNYSFPGSLDNGHRIVVYNRNVQLSYIPIIITIVQDVYTGFLCNLHVIVFWGQCAHGHLTEIKLFHIMSQWPISDYVYTVLIVKKHQSCQGGNGWGGQYWHWTRYVLYIRAALRSDDWYVLLLHVLTVSLL